MARHKYVLKLPIKKAFSNCINFLYLIKVGKHFHMKLVGGSLDEKECGV